MFGESVSYPTPMRIEPASDAPVVQSLSPGDSFAVVDESDLPTGMSPLPEGWSAIRFEADYQGYVNNNEVLKNLTAEVGAGVLMEASLEAPLLTVVEMDDITQVTDVTGEWSRIIIRKPLVGYIDAGAVAESEAPVAQVAAAAAIEPTPAVLPPPPMTTAAPNADVAPILMNGRLERTRRVFGRGPDQEYQLIGKEGKVIAYLETDSLILTEPVDAFLGLVVNVFGVPRKPAESKALILRVETLRVAQP
ncbi:MAG: hypothetical protein R3F07_07400 [Opitutaceae bacterium]